MEGEPSAAARKRQDDMSGVTESAEVTSCEKQ